MVSLPGKQKRYEPQQHRNEFDKSSGILWNDKRLLKVYLIFQGNRYYRSFSNKGIDLINQSAGPAFEKQMGTKMQQTHAFT